MTLGGLHRNSLIDYPGRISCVLFLTGCNFRCPYCHNPGLARGGPPQTPLCDDEEVYSFLERRRQFLEGVVLTGGEPTLTGDLVALCERIKTLGYPVKLDTNGSRPEVLKKLIREGLVDYVAMDIKTDPFRYSPVIAEELDPATIFKSVQVVMESAPAYEFRTTCVRPLVDRSAVEAIAELISGAPLYALQRFHQADVLDPAFFKDGDAVCGEEEILLFHSVAAPRVKSCIIR